MPRSNTTSTRYTAFCREADGSGTTWIGPCEGDTPEEALEDARESCASDWGFDVEDVKCIGLAAGDVDIVLWEDEE